MGERTLVNKSILLHSDEEQTKKMYSPFSRDEQELRASWDEFSEAKTFKDDGKKSGLYDDSSSDDDEDNAVGLQNKNNPNKVEHVTLTNYHIVFFTLAPFAFVVSVLMFIGFAYIPGRVAAK